MTISRQDVDRQIDKMSKLPILPQILVKLNQVAEDSHASAEDLGRIILKDQALTLRILRVVNSAFYRHRRQRPITTVSKAVVFIGFNGIRRLALGMSVCDVLRAAEQVPMVQGFWSHSLATAITARLLAEKTGFTAKEEVFVGGLVHDIGKLVLARCAPDHYAGLLQDVATPTPLRARERRLCGLSHAQAGKRLARLWGLPSILEEVIGDHHAYDSKGLGPALPPALRLVIAANRFSQLVLSRPQPAAARRAVRSVQEVAHLNDLQIDALYTDVVQEFTDLAKAFSIENLPAEIGKWQSGQERPEIDRDELIVQLQAISAAMVSQPDPNLLVELILDGLMATLAVDRLFLLVRCPTTGRLVCRASRGSVTTAQEEAFSLPIEPDAAGPADGGFSDELLATLQAEEFATIPLHYHDTCEGLLWLDNPLSERLLSKPLLETAATFANSLALVLGGFLCPGSRASESRSPVAIDSGLC